MASNILAVPFKRTKNISLVDGLKDIISNSLGQSAEQFQDELVTLDKLRADIVTLDVHPSSLERLIKYHRELLSISSKLPVDVNKRSFMMLIDVRLESHLLGIQVSVP